MRKLAAFTAGDGRDPEIRQIRRQIFDEPAGTKGHEGSFGKDNADLVIPQVLSGQHPHQPPACQIVGNDKCRCLDESHAREGESLEGISVVDTDIRGHVGGCSAQGNHRLNGLLRVAQTLVPDELREVLRHPMAAQVVR